MPSVEQRERDCMFRRKSLDTILSSFDRVAADLSRHVEKKTHEQLELLAEKSVIEDEIIATAHEVDRSHRVLSKVRELVA